MARWTAALLAMVFSLGAVAAEPQAGNEYRVLSEPQPVDAEGAVQVREFFSYGCPHCFDFNPLLQDWQSSMSESVSVEHVPVTFGRDSWALLAKAYYVADALGVLDKTHDPLFAAIHEDGRRFESPEAIAEFYAEQGVDEEEALKAFDSFAVTMKMRRAERLVRDYGVRATPTLAVAGKYVIGVREAGGQSGMLEVAGYLVDKEQQ
ncbi:thiol:disulfide interchange protein DsbA/DsbL [Arhodomonas sp. AD133]|uniref:thiol:disulfide interchange protein DsbA/DsbL n=1 Tax=Arhodomonas sp. AD133 TaxID=3415009 RepID=UPI003EBA786B